MDNELKNKKIALVHDYLLGIGGAERVLKTLHEIFPTAPIYALVYDDTFVKEFLPHASIRGSFLQKLPLFLRKRYKYFSPLIPSAVERLDLSQFDIVISSSSAFAKGVITRPDTVHICYCHTPTRYLWDWTHEYAKTLKGGMQGLFVKIFIHLLRLWDQQAARRVDYFVANSRHVAARIKKYYGREAKVIYPPVSGLGEEYGIDSLAHSRPSSEGLRGSGGFAPDCGRGTMPKPPSNPPESNTVLPIYPPVEKLQATSYKLQTKDYYLIVSQLRPYKQIDIAIEAFKKLEFPLVVVGEGGDKKRLLGLAKGVGNIKFLGRIPDDSLIEYYRNCKALIFSGEEDFGMTMVEAMLAGKPVLALRKGGAKEILVEGMTGEFFDDAHPLVLADGVRRLNENYKNYSEMVIKKRAEKFSREVFECEILEFVGKCCKIEV